jgi:hypothetical protein
MSRKNCIKNKFFAGILKVNDQNSRIRIQDPDPDQLVRLVDFCRIQRQRKWSQEKSTEKV